MAQVDGTMARVHFNPQDSQLAPSAKTQPAVDGPVVPPDRYSTTALRVPEEFREEESTSAYNFSLEKRGVGRV